MATQQQLVVLNQQLSLTQSRLAQAVAQALQIDANQAVVVANYNTTKLMNTQTQADLNATISGLQAQIAAQTPTT